MSEDDYVDGFRTEQIGYQADNEPDTDFSEAQEPEEYTRTEGILSHESYDLNDRDESVKLQHGIHREAEMQGMSHKAAAEVWASLTDDPDQNRVSGSEILEELVRVGYTSDIDTDNGPSYDFNLD